MTLSAFNNLEIEVAAAHLFACCGSVKWVSAMMREFPFSSEKKLVDQATECWYHECAEMDWRESFTHHPKIGDVKSLTEKFAGTEQAALVMMTR